MGGRASSGEEEGGSTALCGRANSRASGSQGLVSPLAPPQPPLPWRVVADVKTHWEPGSTHPGSSISGEGRGTRDSTATAVKLSGQPPQKGAAKLSQDRVVEENWAV